MPTEFMPLHVFEPRYRTLVEVCLAGEPEFGVVLIERGSEAGGGDIRFDIGPPRDRPRVRDRGSRVRPWTTPKREPGSNPRSSASKG